LAAGLLAAAAMACGIVLGKRWGRPTGVGALAFTGWQLAFGGLLLAPAALLTESFPVHLTAINLGGYAYLAGINTLLAYWLWFRGTAVLAPTALSFLGLLSPVGAALIGWWALGQGLGPVQVLGLALALIGIVLGQLAPASVRRRPHTLEPSPTATRPALASGLTCASADRPA
jgi:probable blue pigment (indigoidine) exporter